MNALLKFAAGMRGYQDYYEDDRESTTDKVLSGLGTAAKWGTIGALGTIGAVGTLGYKAGKTALKGAAGATAYGIDTYLKHKQTKANKSK